MAIELGTAYVNILPSTRDIAPGIKQAVGDAEKAGRSAANRTGSKLGGGLVTGLKRATKVGLAGGALFAGIAGKKGLERLMGIEDARASLKGLGHDAKNIDKIMENALASVKGTAFGMADAGKVAASAVAAGVEPGKDLTANLKLVADAATIAKTDMGSMGTIFNKVAATGKMQGEVVQQLGERGIPILQFLSKELGVTTEEVVALSSSGQINFETFSKAMQSGLGGAALASGETTRGAFKNMGAAIGRVGANLLSGVFPKFAGGFSSITDALGPMEKSAKKWGEQIGEVLTSVGKFAGPILKEVAGHIGDFVKGMKDGTGPGGVFADVMGVVGDGLKKVFGFLSENKEVVVTFVTVLGTLAGAVTLVSVAVGIFNAVMAINPVTLVVVAIAALAAGLVYAYKKSETFRALVDHLWQKVLKPFGSWLADKLPGALQVVGLALVGAAEIGVKVFGFLLKTVLAVFGGILSAAAKAFGWVPGVGDKIKLASETFNLMEDTANAALDSIGNGLADAKVGLENLGKVKAKPHVSGNSIRAAETATGKTKSALSDLDKVVARPSVKLGGLDGFFSSLADVGRGLDKIIAKSKLDVGNNAKGTDNWRGGLTWVGEEGPELINLQKGAQVIPNHRLDSVGREIRGSASGAAAPSSSSALPSTLTLRVGDRDFTAYVAEVAGDTYNGEDAFAGMTRRMA